MGRKPLHYCLLRFFSMQTKSYVSTGTYRLFLVNCKVPAIIEADRTLQTVGELVGVLHNTSTLKKKFKHTLAIDVLTATL